MNSDCSYVSMSEDAMCIPQMGGLAAHSHSPGTLDRAMRPKERNQSSTYKAKSGTTNNDIYQHL